MTVKLDPNVKYVWGKKALELAEKYPRTVYTMCVEAASKHELAEVLGDVARGADEKSFFISLGGIPEEEWPGGCRVKHGRDHGDRFTMGDLVEPLAEALDRDPDDSTEFCTIIDREFLYGAWGWLIEALPEGSQASIFLADLRGLVRSAYREGHKRGFMLGLEEGKNCHEDPTG